MFMVVPCILEFVLVDNNKTNIFLLRYISLALLRYAFQIAFHNKSRVGIQINSPFAIGWEVFQEFADLSHRLPHDGVTRHYFNIISGTEGRVIVHSDIAICHDDPPIERIPIAQLEIVHKRRSDS